MNIQAAKAALAHLDLDENPVSVRAKSREGSPKRKTHTKAADQNPCLWAPSNPARR